MTQSAFTVGGLGGGSTDVLGLNSSNGYRLSLASGVPVTTTDTTSSTIYCVPYLGNNIALNIGSNNWINTQPGQLSIAIPAVTNTMYDVFMYYNSGSPALHLEAWTNTTTRAIALAYQNGVLVLNGSIQYRYLGSFFVGSSSGQTSDAIAARYLWNYYNRITRNMLATDPTNSWIYFSPAWRQANNNPNNQLNFVCGVVEDSIYVSVQAAGAASGTSGVGSGVGINSTTVNSATRWGANFFGTIYNPSLGFYEGTTYRAGLNFFAWLEIADGGASITWVGTGISILGFQSGLGIAGTLLM